jgi:hypothetical protein
MILEYEVFYTFTEENKEDQSVKRLSSKMHIKGKSIDIIEANAYLYISQLHGCDINSIVIDDMLYLDEYEDD